MKRIVPTIRQALYEIFIPVLLLSAVVNGQSIQQVRQYEPVVVPAWKLASFSGTPVGELYLFAFRANSQQWELIPFQIDERTRGPNPINPNDSLRFYLIPEEWDISQHDGVLSTHDELVFMVRDLGDRAPARAWIDDADARGYPRLELEVSDPLQPERKAYAYLYRSATLSQPIPKPYTFTIFPELDSISTSAYAVDIGQYGLIEDIVLHKPGGDGIDFFDTQKLRFNGILNIAFIADEFQMTEENLYLYPEIRFTANPVVRAVRRAKMTLRIGSFVSYDTPFFVTAKFYPFSGSVEGGATISREDLNQRWPGSDVMVILKNLRESWDFNEHAQGMRFFNKYNNGVLIDGEQDLAVNPRIDLPIREWSLVSGSQGSLLTYFNFKEENWENVRLYYYDHREGGQYDWFYFGDHETGDLQSYGDFGLLFSNYGGQDISLELSFVAYFIPEKNLSQEDGAALAAQIAHPVQVAVHEITGVTEAVNSLPHEFELIPARPNPFSSTLHIGIRLQQPEFVTVTIYNLFGQVVRTLEARMLQSGLTQISWDGMDRNGRTVPAGLYFLEAKTSSVRHLQKITKIQ